MCRMGKRRQMLPPLRQAAHLLAHSEHGEAVSEQRSEEFYLSIQTQSYELPNQDLFDSFKVSGRIM